MKRATILWVAANLLIGIHGQLLEPTKGGGRIEGQVRGSHGEPIRNAKVRLRGDLPAVDIAVASKDNGGFEFENIPEGTTYTLSAERPGYLNGSYKLNGITARLAVEPKSTLRDIDIVLIPQGVLTGKVVNADDDIV